ncbi:C-GCAxxG-C-C family protein [Gorillibacterium sp. sgz5001074]|uniref:C-GCAxxG-C-C family protein n=1 Tax=Gorillibacterium sp. sgz5001074 TaxID=3446695 RepID=UPI003F679D09
MEQRVELAIRRFREGFNCSQSVVAAYSQELGLEEHTALRVAAGFGGGMGRLQGTCGALAGAYMLAGLKYGKIRGDDTEAQERTYAKVQEMAAQFKIRFGSDLCSEILGVDLRTEEGRRRFKKENMSARYCEVCIRRAAELVEEELMA